MRGPGGKYQILFVCAGNSCRSPFAAEMLHRRCPSALSKRLRVISAGTHAVEGLPSPLRAQTAAERFGVDLSRHRSQAVTAWLLQHSDLILTMDALQLDSVRRIDPAAAERSFLLKAYDLPADHPGGILSVEDPYSGDDAAYIRVYEEIETEIARLLPPLLKAIERVG